MLWVTHTRRQYVSLQHNPEDTVVDNPSPSGEVPDLVMVASSSDFTGMSRGVDKSPEDWASAVSSCSIVCT